MSAGERRPRAVVRRPNVERMREVSGRLLSIPDSSQWIAVAHLLGGFEELCMKKGCAMSDVVGVLDRAARFALRSREVQP